MAQHHFAVDRMLGRLATWLRLIGQDTVYSSHLTGRALLRQAGAENRILLTRDRRLLLEHHVASTLFIESDHFREQLRQVVGAFGLDPFAHPFTRCARCNDRLAEVAKAEVVNRLPAYVLATQERFVRCPRCRRIYWPATHYQHVRDELRAIGFRPTREGAD